MIHAQLDANGVCIGYGNLSKIEDAPNLVYLPDGWNKDFLWRKWDGQWSVEKYLPAPNDQPSEVDLLKGEVSFLRERDARMQDDINAIIEGMTGGV